MRTILSTLTALVFVTLLTHSTVAAGAVCNGLVATIVGTDGPDVLDGTAGPDVIAGLRGGDVINGLDGDDVICAGLGKDTVNGGNGNDRLHGQGGTDTLDAGGGDDILRGNRGADAVDGGDDDDHCLGGDGDDLISNCEAPGALTEQCRNCPCPFFSVPMTTDCWGYSADFQPDECVLDFNPWSYIDPLGVGSNCSCCWVHELGSPSPPCNSPVGIVEVLNTNELEDCRTCLEDYATALNDAGIPITPPYVCRAP